MFTGTLNYAVTAEEACLALTEGSGAGRQELVLMTDASSSVWHADGASARNRKQGPATRNRRVQHAQREPPQIAAQFRHTATLNNQDVAKDTATSPFLFSSLPAHASYTQ
jgi:hypothetical protein